MKPLKLKMTAFGPYKKTEIVDFEELGEHHLFVISGKTGAGKTTIFDGICFALYGTASGQDRENHTMLRSDFADDETHTAVELLFELNGRTYRILRQLGHVKRGNKTKTGEKYEFFEIVNEKEVPCVDRQIVTEIDKKVEELIGLTQDQFKQIVMLPQGEFRKLLTSETENKEEILRRLFKTESYQLLVERLKTKKSDLENEFNQEKQIRDTYIQNIRATFPEREDALLWQVLAEEHYNINQIVSGLTEEVSYYNNKVVTDQKTYEQAYKDHDKKQEMFHQAKTLNERIDELQAKEKDLQTLTEQKHIFEKKEMQLEDAIRAEKIVPYERQVNEWKQEMERRKMIVKKSEQAKQQADEMFKKSYYVYKQEEGKQKEREALSKKLDRLQEMYPIVKELDTTKQKILQLKQKANTTYSELNKLKTKIKDKNEMIEKVNPELEAMEKTVRKYPVKSKLLNEKRIYYKTLRDYKKLLNSKALLLKEVDDKKQIFLKAEKTYKVLEQRWLSNQASVLASHLHDGEACPVCGSKEHPNKVIPTKEMVTTEELEEKKSLLANYESDYHKAAYDLQKTTEHLQEKQEEMKQDGIAYEQVDEEMERINEEGNKLAEEVKRLETYLTKIDQLKESMDKARNKLNALESEKEQLEKNYFEQKSSFQQTRAVFEERVKNIPEDIRILSELKKKMGETEQLKKEMEQTWEIVQKKYLQMKEEQTKAESDLQHAVKQLTETKENMDQAIERHVDALKNNGFISEEIYKRAQMTENAQVELKKELEIYQQNVSTVTKQVSELRVQLKDKKKVDLTELQKQLKHLKDIYEQAYQTVNESKKYYADAKLLKENIIKSHNTVKEKEKELSIIIDLYDVIRGQNNQKISFERYLQIEYLEQIIEAANQRLRRLSNGQYLLIRSDRQESHGRQSGLALDVYDSYTGQMRDVKTLSGGEKFNASLSLALGMSDVIQSFQGNISIETMFIDEGFGSLDEESLSKAIDALIDLQKSGRMIGVISHVQELKTVFPAVLEVKKTMEGHSQTRFMIK